MIGRGELEKWRMEVESKIRVHSLTTSLLGYRLVHWLKQVL